MKILFNFILLTFSFVSLTDALNNVSFSDNLSVGSNISEIIVPRQPNQPQEVYTYGGFEV